MPEGTVSDHSTTPEHQDVLKRIDKLTDWLTGSLGMKGGEKRLAEVEAYKLELEKLGILEKFPGVRKLLFDLKDDIEELKGTTMPADQVAALVQGMSMQIGETVARSVSQVLKESSEKKEEVRAMTKLERLKIVMQLPLQIVTAAGLVLVALIQFWPRK